MEIGIEEGLTSCETGDMPCDTNQPKFLSNLESVGNVPIVATST